MEIEKIEHSPTFKTMDGEEHETKEAAIAHLRRQAIEDMFTRLLSTSAPAHANQSCVTIANSLNEKFDKFPWRTDAKALKAWQTGNTGIPIVDAGMRELWQTGYMHNRVRMIVGSFLVKNLLLSWHEGERWFWDTLLDADLASNSASWQWVAGSGADAAPYFRIFNPILQGEKFDKKGNYVRRYCPELKNLPDKYIHKPWEAPGIIAKDAGIELGKDYPKPIVDLKASRQRALDAFQEIKE